MGITLSPDELQEITGYKRPADQLRELRRLGFYRARPGRLSGVILERSHYDSVSRGQLQAANDASQPRLRKAKR